MKNAVSTHVKTVGGLLPSELLQRVAALDRGLGGLEADDYHLVGERIPEAISRSWGRGGGGGVGQLPGRRDGPARG
ncbi:hypothetical protein [Meiothermus ruber]|uniref:hypothetical protein n=1 Tax=Meiothermus ruber TaxID=277 RepID=UPI00072373DB|nr:hypothetical protein [Meiothermus ruber]GAO74942.1 putative type II DNA modification enzyme [Meiothermus ruber H328]